MGGKVEEWCESEKKEAGRGRHGWEEEEESDGGARPVCVRGEAGACGAPVGRGGRSEKPPLGLAELGRGQGEGGAEGVGWAWCGCGGGGLFCSCSCLVRALTSFPLRYSQNDWVDGPLRPRLLLPRAASRVGDAWCTFAGLCVVWWCRGVRWAATQSERGHKGSLVDVSQLSSCSDSSRLLCFFASSTAVAVATHLKDSVQTTHIFNTQLPPFQLYGARVSSS